MILFDKMAVDLNGKNTAEHDDGLTKVSFLILLHQTFFSKF